MSLAPTFLHNDGLLAKLRVKQRAAVGVLGKWVTRRSRGCCELCDGRDETRLFELGPFTPDPQPSRVLMACGRCREWLDGGTVEPEQAHFLRGAVWHELPAVRLAAGRMLLACEDPDYGWMRDALDTAGVDPRTGEFRR